MKILIFEYINGGGFSATDLPAGLAHEGLVMLSALLDDLIAGGEHEISVLLEQRCLNSSLPEFISIIPVNRGDDVLAVFNKALSACDAVWPIAPESSQILFDITRLIEASGKCLLSSASSAVAKTADKLETFTILSSQGIATITTHGLERKQQFYTQGTVIKPRDGVGCENSYFIDNIEDFNKLLTRLDNWQHYIIQPYMMGDTLSISALFNNGIGCVICVNRQQLGIQNQCFKLLGCEVNCITDTGQFQLLLTQIAKAFPDLWGYVGIDVIEQHNQLVVVEINPRLTSSYAGIAKALGINIASEVIKMLNGFVLLSPERNQSVHVSLNKEQSYAV